MTTYHYRIISTVAIFFCSVQLAHGASYTVTTTDDEADVSPVCLTGTATDCSLREAVIASNGNSGSDTISIPAGTYTLNGLTTSGENAAATGDLDLIDTNGTLTITGAGSGLTIVNGNDTDRVFETATSTTTIFSDLTVTNGKVASSGGGLLLQGNTTLTKVVVSSNEIHTGGFGGGIRCNQTTLAIDQSTITNNTTTGSLFGAGMNSNDCHLTITNSSFTSNTSASGGGGAVIGMEASTTVTITDTTFSGNTAVTAGGLYLSTSATPSNPVILNRVTVHDNTSTGVAGGILVDTPAQFTNTTVTDNTTTGAGGGIYVQNDADADLTMAFSTITNNTANLDGSGSDQGGGIYVAGASADVRLRTSVLAGNTAPGGVGPNCYATAGFTSATYTLLENQTDCTIGSISDNTVTSSVSYVVTATLADHGGNVDTLAIAGPDVTDIVPPASCLDAAGATLTTDARGMTRPQSTNCDRGAYEKDQTNPTVNITSGTDTVQCATGSWTNAGATVTDNFSTGLTASTSNTVNVNTLGAQTITYTSTADGDNNVGTNTRTVTVVDTTAPTISVIGEAAQLLTVGDTYTDAGATATDSCDSSVSVTTAGTVDTTTAGTYTITYSASDDSSNAATPQTRTVTVADPVSEDETTELAVPTLSTNGKYLKVLVDGVVVDQVKVNKKTLPSKYRKLKQVSFYDGYTTVVLLTANKAEAKVTVLRLTSGNALKKKVSKTFAVTKRNKLTLKFKVNKHRITAQVGKGSNQTTQAFKLKANGKLVKL